MPRCSARRGFVVGAALVAGAALACGSSSSSISGDRDGGTPEDGMILPLRDAPGADDAGQPDSSGGDLDATRAPVDASVDRGAGDGDLAVDAVDAAAGTMLSVYVTFYGWADNSPPGGAIAYPKSGGFPTVHDVAGGTGTLGDPVTFATDKAEFPAGTILYVPFIEKYVVMEDDCAECDSDWTGSQKRHIDVWMNSNAAEDHERAPAVRGRLDAHHGEHRGEPARRSCRDDRAPLRSVDERVPDRALRPARHARAGSWLRGESNVGVHHLLVRGREEQSRVGDRLGRIPWRRRRKVPLLGVELSTDDRPRPVARAKRLRDRVAPTGTARIREDTVPRTRGDDVRRTERARGEHLETLEWTARKEGVRTERICVRLRQGLGRRSTKGPREIGEERIVRNELDLGARRVRIARPRALYVDGLREAANRVAARTPEDLVDGPHVLFGRRASDRFASSSPRICAPPQKPRKGATR